MAKEEFSVFLSYSRNDLAAADELRRQIALRGLTVFKDDDCIREGDLWLVRLQDAMPSCAGTTSRSRPRASPNRPNWRQAYPMS